MTLVSLVALAAPAAGQRKPLDLDNSGQVEPFTDLVYVARRLFNFTPIVPELNRQQNPNIPDETTMAARIDLLIGSPPTATPTASITRTATATATASRTSTNTPLNTSTPVNTVTRTHTNTPVPPSSTPSITGTRTRTPTRTPTPSKTPTTSPTPKVMEGADVVRGAAEVAVQNSDTFGVLDLGCAAAGCSDSGGGATFAFAVAPRSAIASAGGGSRQPACATETCVGNVQTVTYDNCAETVGGHRVVRNGTATLTVAKAGGGSFCPAAVLDPYADTTILQLTNFTLKECDLAGGPTCDVVGPTVFARLTATNWSDTVVPVSPRLPGCTPQEPNGVASIDGVQILNGSLNFACSTGATSLPCRKSSVDIELDARALRVERTSGGFPCELGLSLYGELDVVDRDRNAANSMCTTRISQRFGTIDAQGAEQGFFIGETRLLGQPTPGVTPGSLVRQRGQMSVDVLGDLLLDTVDPQAGSGTPGPTPDATPAYLFVGSAKCPSGGDGALRVQRPPLVAPAAAASSSAPLFAPRAPGQVQRFEHDLYRATDGSVFQVLRNRNAFGAFGAEAIQITSLIGSEAGGVGQCAVTAGAIVNPQAVAAVEPGNAFPLGSVRKSAIIPFSEEAVFNPNAGPGFSGAVCIGDAGACNENAECTNPTACQVFTVAGGTALDSVAPHPIPRAQLVQLPLFADPCGGFGRQFFNTYRFGTSGPTVDTVQCDPFGAPPTKDGFRLRGSVAPSNRGESAVFVYDASYASLFNAAVAGFPVTAANTANGIGCPLTPDRVLHLGVSALSSVQAPLITFTDDNGPSVTLDFQGDGSLVETEPGCVGFSAVSQCN